MANKSKTETAQIDPVCGMEVQAADAAGRSVYEEQTYYFCSAECKREFDENPEDYV
jgi:Cu+-exporting ATPase